MRRLQLILRFKLIENSLTVTQLTELAVELILLSCQPKVTVTSCFVYKVIRDSESIDYLCIDPIHRIGLIHK